MTFTETPPDFQPHPLLRNRHLMTIAPAFLWRRTDRQFQKDAERRRFRVANDSEVLAHCHWHPDRNARGTLIVLHGLEGSSESSHVLALAQKAFRAGMNAIRLNLRNCGGSMELTPTLYNAGLSADLLTVAAQLRAEGLPQLLAAGYSLGGNIVLKAAGETSGESNPLLCAVAAVSPAIDLKAAVTAIEKPENRLYDLWFLRTLKEKIREKEKLFPGRFDVGALARVRTLRDFDDLFTAPDAGYRGADDYYFHASAVRVISHIKIPALVIAAKDDPLVPYEMFQTGSLDNRYITFLSTEYGGHTGFVQRAPENGPLHDRFWAENRVLQFSRDILCHVSSAR